MIDCLYELKLTSFDYHDRIILYGPKVDDWERFCDALIPEIAARLFIQSGHTTELIKARKDEPGRRYLKEAVSVSPEELFNELEWTLINEKGYIKMNYEGVSYDLDASIRPLRDKDHYPRSLAHRLDSLDPKLYELVSDWNTKIECHRSVTRQFRKRRRS